MSAFALPISIKDAFVVPIYNDVFTESTYSTFIRPTLFMFWLFISILLLPAQLPLVNTDERLVIIGLQVGGPILFDIRTCPVVPGKPLNVNEP